MWQPPTISEVGREVATCLEEGDQRLALRLVLRFFEHYEQAGLDDRTRMVVEAPAETGDQRFDAMLAAVAEYSCAVYEVVPPAWVNEARFFLDEFWFVAGLPGLEADALANSPISFARRGVFVNSGALTYA